MSELLSILGERTPAKVSATLTLDKHVRSEIIRLEADLLAAHRADEELNRVPEAPAIAQRIVDLRDSVRTITFTFSELARTEWETLVRAHPARPMDTAGGAEWNSDTLPPALMRAACVGWVTSDGRNGDGMSSQEAAAWWGDDGSDGPGFADARTLWRAALAAQSDGGDIPKVAAAIALLRSIEQNSTTARQQGSPIRS